MGAGEGCPIPGGIGSGASGNSVISRGGGISSGGSGELPPPPPPPTGGKRNRNRKQRRQSAPTAQAASRATAPALNKKERAAQHSSLPAIRTGKALPRPGAASMPLLQPGRAAAKGAMAAAACHIRKNT